MNSRNTIIIFFISFLLLYSACQNKPRMSDNEVIMSWVNMTNYITQYTPANSPTFASRAYGYIALCMYESVVHGSPEHNTLAGQLNELDKLSSPDPSEDYDWLISLNAAQSEILKFIYLQTSDKNKESIDSLENSILKNISKQVDREVVQRSIQYGKTIAAELFEWSKTDGGHRGYLANFDKEFVHPDFPGSWKPPLFAQSFSHHPLHPYWGDNRTFLSINREVDSPTFIPFDTNPDSEYYQQFLAVYQKELELTQEEKETAIWWGDDPDVTFTPPGHSYYIAGLIVEQLNLELCEAAEALALTALSVADSFIRCWEWKYKYFSERPNTFVPQYIDQEWESFWPDPPFPAFPSGHAIQAAAAATSLEHLFGEGVPFTDRAHEGRKRDEVRNTDFVSRSFDTFWSFAQETADSRFYGGIHTQQDNEAGLIKGVEIANNVINLDWRKSQ